ncbi:ABC transporter permease [Halovulum sp. GXIMD14794]
MTSAVARTPSSDAGQAAIGTGLILLGWELAARSLDGAHLLAAPSAVVLHIVENAGLYARALRTTLAEAAAGFVFGNLAAVILAAIATLWPRSERVVLGLALIVFCMPLVATGPILRVLYGPGPGPQVTLAALAVYYTTLVPLLVGLRAVPASWIDMVRSYGRGRLAALLNVRARAALPYLFAGLQIAAPAAFLGAMVGEFTGAERGMGVLTIRAMRALDVEATWALAAIAAAVSIFAYAAIGILARTVLNAPPPVILAPPPVARSGRAAAPLLALATMSLSILGFAILGWWAALEVFDMNAFFAKRPDDVWRFLFAEADAAANRATLGAALTETAVTVGPGYVAGLAMGAGLAIALTIVPALGAVALPLAIALRSVPIVTTAPLLVLLVGRGLVGTVTLVAVMVFFPVLVACLHGLKQAPGQVLDVFASYGAGRVSRLAHAQLPAMLPAFFAAARMTVPAAVLAVTVVEWLATGRGIGSLMALSASLSDYGMLWSAVVVVALLSAVIYASVAALETRVLALYASEQIT